MRIDSDLDVLRGRRDLQTMMAELTKGKSTAR